MSDLLSIYKELQAKKWVDLTHKINAESPKIHGGRAVRNPY